MTVPTVNGSITTAVNSSNSTGETISTHNVAGSDITLVVIVKMFSVASNGVDSITWNGTSMGTAVASDEYNYTINRYFNLLTFTLDGADTGTNDLVVSFSGTAAANSITLITLNNANNGNNSNTGSSTGSDDNPAATFTTDDSNSLIVWTGVMLGADSDPFTPDGSETERVDGDTGGGSATTDFGYHVMTLPATGGADTLSSTASVSDEWLTQAIAVSGTAAGTAIGLNSETDTALGLTAEKSKTTGLPTETDTALALTAQKAKDTGLSSETDTALALTRVKSKELGIVTETGTPLPVTPAGGMPIGIAAETDAPLGLARVKSRAIGIVTETAVPLGLTGQKSRTLGLLTETNTPLALTRFKTLAVGLVSETDTALAFVVQSGSVVRYLTLEGEFETAVSLEGEFETAVSLAGEFAPAITLEGEL